MSSVSRAILKQYLRYILKDNAPSQSKQMSFISAILKSQEVVEPGKKKKEFVVKYFNSLMKAKNPSKWIRNDPKIRKTYRAVKASLKKLDKPQMETPTESKPKMESLVIILREKSKRISKLPKRYLVEEEEPQTLKKTRKRSSQLKDEPSAKKEKKEALGEGSSSRSEVKEEPEEEDL